MYIESTTAKKNMQRSSKYIYKDGWQALQEKRKHGWDYTHTHKNQYPEW